MSDLPPSARKVAQAALALGLGEIEVLEMAESTRTAADAAAACGCTLGQIVKSLVFLGAESGRAYLLLVSGPNRVDEAGAAARLGEPLVRADADTVRALSGFAVGGVPPFGHAQALETSLDEDLMGFDRVWAAAGTPRCVFAVDPRRLAEAVRARVMRVN